MYTLFKTVVYEVAGEIIGQETAQAYGMNPNTHSNIYGSLKIFHLIQSAIMVNGFQTPQSYTRWGHKINL